MPAADAGGGCAASSDESDSEESSAEPGFRELASVTLADKPNWLAAVSDSVHGGGRAVICVATTGSLIEVLRA